MPLDQDQETEENSTKYCERCGSQVEPEALGGGEFEFCLACQDVPVDD